MLVNLHHLDTARNTATGSWRMQAGRVVFDGPPEALDAARVRAIYGITEAEFAAEAAARAAAAQPRVAMA